MSNFYLRSNMWHLRNRIIELFALFTLIACVHGNLQDNCNCTCSSPPNEPFNICNFINETNHSIDKVRENCNKTASDSKIVEELLPEFRNQSEKGLNETENLICEGDPPTIKNGSWEKPLDRQSGSRVQYVCDGNFNIGIKSTVRCKFGEWIGDPPFCICKRGWYGKDCDQICNCAMGARDCHRGTGACKRGCIRGWVGNSCEFRGYFDTSLTVHKLPGILSPTICYSYEAPDMKFLRMLDSGKAPKFVGNYIPVVQDIENKKYFGKAFYSGSGSYAYGAFNCNYVDKDFGVMGAVALRLPSADKADLQALTSYQVANAGDTVKIAVKIAKKQASALQWMHNGRDLSGWENNTMIELQNVSVNDSGVYECFYKGRREKNLHAYVSLHVRNCSANMFGVNCDLKCLPCYNGGICEDKYGICLCPEGFSGARCEIPCGVNRFGIDCSMYCAHPKYIGQNEKQGCAFQMFCKPGPFGCSCAPGYKAPTCTEECEPGWYGADCKQPCHCADGPTACNKVTGACEGGCAAGWFGESCQIETCKPGSYGIRCNGSCNCKNGHSSCDRVTGTCEGGCPDGWYGNSCTIKGYFDSSFTLRRELRDSSPVCCYSEKNHKNILFSLANDTTHGRSFPSDEGNDNSRCVRGIDRLGVFQCQFGQENEMMKIVSLHSTKPVRTELRALHQDVVANLEDNVKLEVEVLEKLNPPIKCRLNDMDVPFSGREKILTIVIEKVQPKNAGIYECFYEGRKDKNAHALMRLIVRNCRANMFGPNCDRMCPTCYNGGICHETLGICVCPAGFIGFSCETVCGVFFGEECLIPCDSDSNAIGEEEQCKYTQFCKPDPYGCSCASGFKGSLCDIPCEPGWYGADCKQPCHCANGPRACDRVTGACQGGCAKGWSGNSCQIGYFDDSFIAVFSPSKSSNILCFSDKNVTFSGTRNFTEVVIPLTPTRGLVGQSNHSSARLGAFSSIQCEEENGAMKILAVMPQKSEEGKVQVLRTNTVRNTGEAIELDAKLSERMESRIRWWYNGQRISSWDRQSKLVIRNAKPENSGIYEYKYEGERNDTVRGTVKVFVRKCVANMYANDCSKKCPSCFNGGICHDTLGICVCPPGFSGAECKTDCIDNPSGADCSKYLDVKKAFEKNDGYDSLVFCKPDPYGCSCAPGYEGPFCNEPCNRGLYGVNCNHVCHCAKGATACNKRTGACEGGCGSGWKGDSCEEKILEDSPSNV